MSYEWIKCIDLMIRLNEIEIFNDFEFMKGTLKTIVRMVLKNVKQCEERHV